MCDPKMPVAGKTPVGESPEKLNRKKGRNENMKRRFWAGLLSFVMLWFLLPVSALAADEENEEAELETEVSTSENSPVQVKKTINGDGTKLTLEAYAINEVTQTSSTKPLDIVLVLDQSGSMAYNFDGKDEGSPSERCQYAMKQAVNSFIEEATSADGTHNMAIVTFGTDVKVLNSGWTKVDTEGAKALTKAINELPDKPTGATDVGAGMKKAQELMNSAKRDTNRQKVVIVFTDGVPTTTNEFDTGVANSAITAAKTMKNAGVTVYTVGIFNGANPAQLAKVLKEAEEFKGPSLIIAYAPCINHGLVKGMGCAQQEAKEAVAAGYWNLYHYNPDLKKEGKNPFVLDSKEPTLNLRDFLMGEVRFSALTRTFPEEAEKLLAEAELDAKEKYQEYKKLAEG